MRILIYGAGVIGSLYAVLFDQAGVDTSLYARGARLQFLQEKGLLYYKNQNIIKSKHVKVISELKDEDMYDFVFLCVRENQLKIALQELKKNKSDIVTFVNSIEDYRSWENICGKGRIIPAFPGAGGSLFNSILDADLTPALIQPTTFGEISGQKTTRIKNLKSLFHKANIPIQIVKDMHLWQLCHLGMVVPIADAYYEAIDAKRAGYDKKVMLKTAKQLKKNFKDLKKQEGTLSPAKMNIFLIAPAHLISICLSIIFKSKFGDKFMYQHSMKAPDEMRELHKQFYTYMKSK